MIDVNDLTKRYRDTVAVDGVSFTCAPGTVTGLLGPNGAGKSTTLRMLLGLVHPTSGTATVGGVPYDRIGSPARVVGAMLDASALHPGRTCRETLRVTAGLLDLPSGVADTALERVGLSGAARRRVGRLSLGMRQRLGIAHALLGDPSVLVLDEPVNGLDPDGMRWMRGLLREFASGGGTVLLSSHLLGEVGAVADRVVAMREGRVVGCGPVAELASGAGGLEDWFLARTGGHVVGGGAA
ncbi:ABC-2 type transport system ATP-binding protein [Pseudonocardia sediminis]|uniref:ABC-2 type transport system ATP-binding protein n=1 Tax=Pseudonocardia sediminis TaxID=1397368 RepID=A0A4Q7V587_PSEST|nr:ATP-binding cassette domain-containing protein [Pseudonocardia sediminis]RZT88878.1 ABC-2 type transport system ATP-binding protein [Pseudonocardia sediminis]